MIGEEKLFEEDNFLLATEVKGHMLVHHFPLVVMVEDKDLHLIRVEDNPLIVLDVLLPIDIEDTLSQVLQIILGQNTDVKHNVVMRNFRILIVDTVFSNNLV
jgi:hypothetical protein